MRLAHAAWLGRMMPDLFDRSKLEKVAGGKALVPSPPLAHIVDLDNNYRQYQRSSPGAGPAMHRGRTPQ